MHDESQIEDWFTAIVRDNPAAVIRAQAQVCNAMQQRDCIFDGAPLPHFLKPYFLSPNQTELLAKQAQCLVGALEKVTRLYFSHPEFKEVFNLSPSAAALIDIDPGYDRHVVISRPDAFLAGDQLQFIEFNCDSPAGAMYTDLQEDIFLESFPMRQLEQRVTWRRFERKRAVLDALLNSYRDFGGKQETPLIAIADWRDVKTLHEFELLKGYFKSQGYPTIIVDPRDLEFKQGALYHDKDRIDIIYRRAI